MLTKIVLQNNEIQVKVHVYTCAVAHRRVSVVPEEHSSLHHHSQSASHTQPIQETGERNKKERIQFQ